MQLEPVLFKGKMYCSFSCSQWGGLNFSPSFEIMKTSDSFLQSLGTEEFYLVNKILDSAFPPDSAIPASPPAPIPSGKGRRHERQPSWALFINAWYFGNLFQEGWNTKIMANLSRVYWNLSDLMVDFFKWVTGKISQGLISELELRLCLGVLSTQWNTSSLKYFVGVEIRHLWLYIFFSSWLSDIGYVCWPHWEVNSTRLGATFSCPRHLEQDEAPRGQPGQGANKWKLVSRLSNGRPCLRMTVIFSLLTY